jgi:hypothetical protein
MSVKSALYSALNSNRLGKAILQTRRNMRLDDGVARVCTSTHDFIDRSKGSDKLCIILAGYKPTLWEDVFSRIAAYAPADVDVCVMTSGLVNEELKQIAADHGWSYLSTSVNHLSLVQNIAIECHPNAKWIYKLDEDMFITKGFFEAMLSTYQVLENNTLYKPAFVSPLINVSCYGHLRLLEKVGLLDDFRSTGLTDMKYSDGLHHNRQVISEPRVARYMWGESQPVLRDIDALTERFSNEGFSYSVCPVRYSIGAILFTRQAWDEFGHFPITFVGSEFGLGDDEEHICNYACFTGRVMVVNENVVVGHLGYGGAQTKTMVEYHAEHREQFRLKV